jgi:hypothetical protein
MKLLQSRILGGASTLDDSVGIRTNTHRRAPILFLTRTGGAKRDPPAPATGTRKASMPGRSNGGPAAVHGATMLLIAGRVLRSPSISNQTDPPPTYLRLPPVPYLPATAQAGLTRPQPQTRPAS